jgi:hypothetical protein
MVLIAEISPPDPGNLPDDEVKMWTSVYKSCVKPSGVLNRLISPEPKLSTDLLKEQEISSKKLIDSNF